MKTAPGCMHVTRRTMMRTAACGFAVAAHRPLLQADALAASSELQVIATVLRAQAEPEGQRPVLIAKSRFSTARMTALAVAPTALQKASHQVEVPYLVPPASRMADADQIVAAYNNSLKQPALKLVDNAIFTFRHRVLNDAEVVQFQLLNAGGGVYSEDLERRRRAVPAYYRRLFGGATTLYEISRFARNSGDTIAVIGLRSSGSGCSTERWYALERTEGTWHDLHWGSGVAMCV